jgi:glutathione synthase/RimK-type ligase-like ATP-grasp enzyme
MATFLAELGDAVDIVHWQGPQVGDDLIVIEVNDNPTMAEGKEDQRAPRLYA